MLKVDKIFVVAEDLDVREGSPCVLNLFCRDCGLGFLRDLATTLLEATPGPLNLNCSDVIHRESMVLEEAPCQRHFVCGLDQSGTEVSHALLFVPGHHVEW